MKIALDTETGGLVPSENPILALAMYNPEHAFSTRIKCPTNLTCHPRALEVNRLDPTQGDMAYDAQIALGRWWESLGSPRFELIGHNVGPFDIGFVKQISGPKHSLMFDYHYRDTATLALALQDAGLVHFGKLNLSNVAERLKIRYDAHGAMQDAMCAWHVWERQIQIVRASKEFADTMDEAAVDDLINEWEVIDVRASGKNAS